MYYYSYIYYILPGLILAAIAQMKVSSAYEKYSRIPSETGLTGADVAEKIMAKYNMHNVRIRPVNGKMTDHYNPMDKTLNLSREVYNGRSIAALSIAAHEVGHAIQDQESYAPLRIRASLVPAANLGSSISMYLVILGMFFSVFLMKLGIALFTMVVIFQIVTLPVEFNASRRAAKELSYIMPSQNLEGTKKVLTAAALTYVASTLVAIGQLLRLLAMSNRRRD